MNYGQHYSPNYGAPPVAPGFAPQYGGLAALAPSQGFMTAAGDVPVTAADGTGNTGTGSTVTDWLNTPTLGVQRKYLLGGAAALTAIYYAYNQGWFEGGRRAGSRARRDASSRSRSRSRLF